ncbi:Transcription factor iws1 [Penicillium diatomitis]|uniref:Transcription factor iws1 n=1 Tax=Penicillium diatomitis TaxID=2819901 RepID=A0A9W9XF57_9EURO|nr:Transcription factor iws1 [Penicillium diatomitis]KAJ5491139.1 Transcription factor iws1 [Penicillium diatomitis]
MSASPEHQAGPGAASPEPEEVPPPALDTNEAPEDQDNEDEGGVSDDESILSEVDEAQFEDFNPETVDIEDRPQLAIDEDNLKLIGRHKRKRSEEGEGRSSRRKEGRREKKNRRAQDDAEEGPSRRRTARKASPSTDEETLDPETRRRRAIDRAMDEAIKKPGKKRSRKQDGIDLEAIADAEIEEMRKRMTTAAQLDAISRQEGKPAMHKLKLLPEVVILLRREKYMNSLVDPEINLLEAVRFFLEPLDDGSLPAYNIQFELLTCLAKLPIQKDALIASGIGKVMIFYTKSKRTERKIKIMAEKLLADWTRPIIQCSDDYHKRVYETAEYDPTKVVKRSQLPPEVLAKEARERAKLPPRLANRARRERVHVSYTIAPRSVAVQESKFARPLGSGGEDRFRKMQARHDASQKGARSKFGRID